MQLKALEQCIFSLGTISAAKGERKMEGKKAPQQQKIK